MKETAEKPAKKPTLKEYLEEQGLLRSGRRTTTFCGYPVVLKDATIPEAVRAYVTRVSDFKSPCDITLSLEKADEEAEGYYAYRPNNFHGINLLNAGARLYLAERLVIDPRYNPETQEELVRFDIQEKRISYDIIQTMTATVITKQHVAVIANVARELNKRSQGIENRIKDMINRSLNI